MSTPPAVSPHEHIIQLCVGYLFSSAMYSIAELGVADLLEQGPRSPASLAEELGVHAQSLYRALRLLASVGVFAEDESGRFGLTPAADVLRTRAPGSLRDGVLMLAHETLVLPATKLSATLRTGNMTFPEIFGSPFFDHLAGHPPSGNIFHRGMACFSDTENPFIAASYDFTRFQRIVDAGGGHGGFLVEALRVAPSAQGVLFDAEHVLRDARIAAAGLTDRCELTAGSFFESVPDGDCIVLKRVLHDWPDETAVAILRRCRQALRPGGRVLIIDAVILPGNAPDFGKAVDVMMMTLVNGRERTAEEFRSLLAAADLKLERVISTPATLSIVEAAV